MSDTFRTRASTFEIKSPVGKAGYVLRIKPDALKDLIAELGNGDYNETGATLFLNIFENESEYKPGEVYLSSTITPIPTEEREDSKVGSKIGSRINKAYSGKVTSRR